MSKPIYLFKEHQDFQVGKTTLQKGAIFQTNIVWISLGLIIAICFFAASGHNLRKQWRFEATGQETTGIITACEETNSKGSFSTTVEYSYIVGEKTFYGRDYLGAGRQCMRYSRGEIFPVYYLSDEPELSGIGVFLQSSDWANSFTLGFFGFIGLVCVFGLLVLNRTEHYKRAFLEKHARHILEATVTEVDKVHGRHGYLFAKYEFPYPEQDSFVGEIVSGDTLITLTKGYKIQGQIRTGQQYRFPKDIQVGDKLQILYVDDKNYCVL